MLIEIDDAERITPRPVVIHSHGGYDVLAEQHAVAWADGSHVVLHRVHAHGFADMFLRACQADDLHWLVIDLRTLTPRTFELDVRSALDRDHQGIAYYALRLHHPNAEAFLEAALHHFRAAWFATAPAAERKAA